MSVLLCESISKTTATYPITNFNYNFLDKQIYGIFGKSNSGKDTLLDLLSGNSIPNKGNIWIDGENLYEKNIMHERICYIKKNAKFTDLLTVNGLLKLMSNRYPKWDNYYAYSLCKHFNISLSFLVNSLQRN